MNELDSEIIAGQFDKIGMTEAEDEDSADVIILNTCSVRDSAERKVFGKLQLLSHLKAKNPDCVVVLCGCMAEEHKDSLLKKYPQLDIVCGTNSFDALPEMIAEVFVAHSRLTRTGTDREMSPEFLNAKRTSSVKAYVSIMRGCDNYCSYCIVPYVRGPERSRPSQEIFLEISHLAERGFKEVTLLGQNVNSYGRGLKEKTDFPTLLEKIHEIKGIERIRFVTSHPKDISDRLIRNMAELPKVCEYLHFPMQSGSDNILKKMNRGYGRADYLRIVEKLKTSVDGLALSSDFIVGFPSETDDDFEQTLSAVEQIRYDNIFMFKYSTRQGTTAAKFEDDIPTRIKEERHRRLLETQNKISTEIYKSFIGKEVEVLVEGTSRKNPSRLTGRTRDNKIAVFTGEKELIGKIINLRVEDSNIHTLYCSFDSKKIT
mgnify:CR=1 FL=1